jgi:large subunit ribosomal protein L14
MILSKTILKVADNTGAKYVRCLRILKTISCSGKKKYATVGDLILVSIRVCLGNKKVKKGNVFIAVVVRVAKTIKQDFGMLFLNENAVVLLNKKQLPLGTRVFGPISREIRRHKMTKILALAPIIV